LLALIADTSKAASRGNRRIKLDLIFKPFVHGRQGLTERQGSQGRARRTVVCVAFPLRYFCAMSADEPAPGPSQRSFYHRRAFWILLALFLGLAALVSWLLSRPSPASGISVSFIGYTNAPNSAWRFALFSMTNRDRVALRLRGLSTEIEGRADLKAPTFNASLPWITRPNAPPSPVKSGDHLIFAVGEPWEGGKWRVQVRYARSTIKEKLFMFRLTHSVPSLIAEFLPGPPPVTTVTSEWVPQAPAPRPRVTRWSQGPEGIEPR
jgi:hypothetical protein